MAASDVLKLAACHMIHAPATQIIGRTALVLGHCGFKNNLLAVTVHEHAACDLLHVT
jgi:hypothetical protein